MTHQYIIKNYLSLHLSQISGNTLPDICLFEVNNKDARTICEICSKLIIKTPERGNSDFFVVNFEHIWHVNLVFPSLTLKK